MSIVYVAEFSTPGAHARDAAIALARRLGGSLVVVHDFQPYTIDPVDREVELGATRRRLAAIADAARRAGVAAEILDLEGNTDDAIASVVRRREGSLLVVAAHGRHAPMRWLVGDDAVHAMAAASVPVLAVRRRPDAFVRWATEARPLRVLVGIETAAIAPALARTIERLRTAGPCDVTVAHASTGAAATPRLRERLDATIRPRLARLAGTGSFDLCLLRGDDPAASLASLATDGGPFDLVVVGMHARTEVGPPHRAGIAGALVHHGVDPVLAVPLEAEVGEPLAPARRARAILAATDLSPLGNRAVAFAYALVRDGGTVTPCYVHVRPDHAQPVDDATRAEIELHLNAVAAATGCEERGVTSTPLVVEGASAADAIVSTAAELDVDAICIGTHARGGLAQAVLGSVAEAVAHRSHKPVVLVR